MAIQFEVYARNVDVYRNEEVCRNEEGMPLVDIFKIDCELHDPRGFDNIFGI